MPTVCLVAIPSLSLVLVFSFSVSVKCRDSYYRYCTCRLKPFLNCCIYHSRSWFLFVLSVSQYDLISFDNFHSVSYCLQFWLVHYYLASGETLSHSRCVKAISKIAYCNQLFINVRKGNCFSFVRLNVNLCWPCDCYQCLYYCTWEF